MITLQTGVPGMGKTASVVEYLLKNDVTEGRPVFVMGITGLLIDHSKVPPVTEWTEKRPDPDDPTLQLDYFKFPPNSILVVDEAQRVFPARVSGTKVPPHVAALATHRHTGLDILLLTQKPMQLDSWCRELCGRHIHLKKTLLGRFLYEWPEYQDPNNKSNLSEAAKRKFSPPKKVFQYYKSAEVHTTQPFRFHQVYVILAFLLITLAFLGHRLYNGLYKRITQQSTQNEILVQNDKPLPSELTPVNAKPEPIKPMQPVMKSEVLHPYSGFQFHIKAVIRSGRFNRTYYEITKANDHVFTNDQELKSLGYEINQPSDCSAFLYFKGASIVATCSSSSDRQSPGGAPLPTFDPNKPTEI